MLALNQITHLHMEFSSICNARCPLCPRNLFGYPHNNGYEETYIPFSIVEKSFSPDFIKQLKGILINGNLGDFTGNIDAIEILRYFRQHNSWMHVLISTHGSARNAQFWHDLGTLDVNVEFCLDGLEDTHHLYRQDTNWKKIIENAKIFLAAGGTAHWKMIKFKHNEHQIEACQQLAKEIGFQFFTLVDDGRDSGPVFDKKGNLSHIIGNWTGPTTIEDLKIMSNPIPKLAYAEKPNCYSKNFNSIYIAADSKVYPCCWLGFNPHSYHSGTLGESNKQLSKVVMNNSLFEHDLSTAIKWFNLVESSWDIENYQQGRLYACDLACGKCPTSRKERQEDREKL